MNVGTAHTEFIEGYLRLLRTLSYDAKLEIIARLSDSMKSDTPKNSGHVGSLFGAFDSGESAEELISMIRSSRTFNTPREGL